MSSTEHSLQVKLTNQVTGDKVLFAFSPAITPAVTFKLNKRDTLIKRYLSEFDEGKKTDKKEAAEVMNKIMEAGRDIMSMILEIPGGLPEGYHSKRDLIEDCMGHLSVSNTVINLFFEALSDSTASPEAWEMKADQLIEVIR